MSDEAMSEVGAAIDADLIRADLASLPERPVSEHVAVLESTNAALQSALAAIATGSDSADRPGPA